MDETSLQIARRLYPEYFPEAEDEPLVEPYDILPDAVLWFVLVIMACAAAAAWCVLA